ncbi:MAG: c-type cytochrome [Vicinamibacterales bacterium]
MRPTVLVFAVAPLMGLVACSPPSDAPGAATAQVEATHDSVQLALPRGDAGAGRQAFLDLKCNVCHRVVDDAGLPAPFSDSAGPDLDLRRPHRSLSEIATAIVAPSHSLSMRTSSEVRNRLATLSPMGDVTQAMTVRQLADLVEYLRTTPTP